MSLEEFKTRSAGGELLIILDNLVLKVDNFASSHPGGKFVIQHNAGRDISKFFFGGYSLENYPGAKGHNHSNFARMIANDLAIANLQMDIPVSTNIVRINNEKCHNVNKSTKTFFLEADSVV